MVQGMNVKPNNPYYVPTRKGNPLEITVNQHIHTAHCISLFYNDGFVQLFDKEKGKVSLCKKRNAIFCAKRLWDERAEHGYMREIEDAFHSEISLNKSFSERSHTAITEYYILWELRHYYSINPLPDSPLSVDGDELTKEDEEIIEKLHMGYCLKGVGVPSRQIISSEIQLRLMYEMQRHKWVRWGILTSKKGEFLCSDNYRGLGFFPISPTQCFYICSNKEKTHDKKINLFEVSELNRRSILNSYKYWFARNIGKCPV